MMFYKHTQKTKIFLKTYKEIPLLFYENAFYIGHLYFSGSIIGYFYIKDNLKRGFCQFLRNLPKTML